MGLEPHADVTLVDLLERCFVVRSSWSATEGRGSRCLALVSHVHILLLGMIVGGRGVLPLEWASVRIKLVMAICGFLQRLDAGFQYLDFVESRFEFVESLFG